MKRWMTCALAATVTMVFLATSLTAAEKGTDVLRHKMKSLDGKEVDLSKYKGDVVLVVNVASQCGLTPQYEGLQALHEKYGDKGLKVLGFPCNQFGKQEPGSEAEIAEFCTQNYGVTFDMFSKIEVNGDGKCDLYRDLTDQDAGAAFPGPIKWNFEKFLIDRNGNVVARFAPPVKPESEEVIAAIEEQLEKK